MATSTEIPETVAVDSVSEFSDEVDVVVIGFGIAGGCAAAEAADERMERIGWPGEFPFTRGLHATGYRGRPWTIRQFAGFGNARQTDQPAGSGAPRFGARFSGARTGAPAVAWS